MNKEKFDKILEHIMNGFSLRSSCKDVNTDPRVFYDFMDKDESGKLAQQYARACDVRAEDKVSSIHEIADKEEDVQRAKLKIDAIKWEASKLKPKRFGDRQEIQHSGDMKFIIDKDDAGL